ncbi:MAG: DeoR/GlpR family DNA-binding transcription regulator [Pseudomonas paracarnis]|mgnify:CR=1 FL=1|uniref:DeoR/GlpR family DNA-binding transcription regulator n=1 Tax=Comamonas aquatica TaxID=225991 RepID=A0AA42L844_9BURK|nr:DeoR/GlpR family DNA-binding transcription regulator [Comamonas aquatica]MDH0364819.1 DeoR/GlpR family DNA-binding transcription regulator [Comamonas aquatica]
MTPVLSARQERIVEILRTTPSITTVDLAQRLDVSGETVRRDLQAMADDGIVQKFHGGVSLHRDVQESPFLLRLRTNVGAKRRLAQLVSKLLPDGASIVLDNSSTACFVAEALAERRGLTVATPSLEVARTLARCGDRHTVMLPGGTLRSSDMTLASASALRFATQLHPDYMVVSVAALSARGGCLDFDPFEVEFKQAVCMHARTVIVVADASKFEAPGLITSLPWTDVQVLVTDCALPPDLAQACAGIRLEIAEATDVSY